MRARRRVLPTSAIIGALIATSLAVLALAIALAIARPPTDASVPVRAASTPVERQAPTPGLARTGSTEPSILPPFVAHMWMPRSVPIGADRQLRVQIRDGTTVADQGEAEPLRVVFGSDDRRFSVRPAVRILARGQLRDARFAIAARADLRCEDVPAGTLAVTVTSLLDPDRTTSTRVALPEPDCRAAPPEAPASVHVTEAVCGGDHAAQVSRLLEGEELDPRRCASHRWRDGAPRPWPPPRPTPRPRPPPPATDAEDQATEGDDPAGATDENDPANATEGDDPANATAPDRTDPPGEAGRTPDADGQPEDGPPAPPEPRDAAGAGPSAAAHRDDATGSGGNVDR